MPDLAHLPVLFAALAIFLLRIVDVSIGTIRTIALVHGRTVQAVLLGFFEVLIWISVVSQVIAGVGDQPVLLVAYAAGFAAGNGVGILLERRLAMGTQVVRIISQTAGSTIAQVLRDAGQAVTLFTGEGRDGPVRLIYMMIPRRRVTATLDLARSVDPQLFYVVESVSDGSRRPDTTSPSERAWFSAFKKK